MPRTCPPRPALALGVSPVLCLPVLCLPVLCLPVLCLLLSGAQPARAEGFHPVTQRDNFVSLIDGRELRRFGIRLNVLPQGDIRGHAFGSQVSGKWTWQRGFFCRSLSWGRQELGPNCQAVKVRGDTVRFISDRGQGDYADLYLR